mmetsp:Transcript_17604/g.24827  ORF Transcript_17604/g.24827 Transcript_17604/m.24827 type:complete len:80 (+) Transcript_17604:256-495(+)
MYYLTDNNALRASLGQDQPNVTNPKIRKTMYKAETVIHFNTAAIILISARKGLPRLSSLIQYKVALRERAMMIFCAMVG